VSGSGVSDTLIGITDVVAAGGNDTVIGNGGSDVLSAVGTGETLIGGGGPTTLVSNAAGNLLEAETGRAVASYSADTLAIDLSAGTASINGSAVSDTLVGISNVTASGNDNTLIADDGTDVLSVSVTGDILIGGGGDAHRNER
jgi:hypothetical protein